MASQPVTGKTSLSSSYSTRPTSCLSWSTVRSALSSSSVRAPPVEGVLFDIEVGVVVMGATVPRLRQDVQQYVETLGNLLSRGGRHGCSGRQGDRPVRSRAPHRRAGGVP